MEVISLNVEMYILDLLDPGHSHHLTLTILLKVILNKQYDVVPLYLHLKKSQK